MTELKNIKDLHLLRKIHKIDINGFMALKESLAYSQKYGFSLYYESGYFLKQKTYEGFVEPHKFDFKQTLPTSELYHKTNRNFRVQYEYTI